MLSNAADPVDSDGGFLFATFVGEASLGGEQVYFAVSQDGCHWNTLNEAKPVLTNNSGDGGVRDPYILRGHDSKNVYVLATDLSINRNRDWLRAARNGSKSLVIWDSDDLVNWSDPRSVPVAAADAGCAWAPEAVYDEETQDYLVFWASTNAGDGFGKHRIWASRTKDFRLFGQPFVTSTSRITSSTPTSCARAAATIVFPRTNPQRPSRWK